MAEAPFPVEEWLTTLALYLPVDLGIDYASGWEALIAWRESFDVFCPGCGRHATFRGALLESQDESRKKKNLFTANDLSGRGLSESHEKMAFCTREAAHRFYFYFRLEGTLLLKVGQFPSLADILVGQSSEAVRALGADTAADFNRAIGLAAHGVGAGSLVYLRRIFETLVEDAHLAAKDDQGWDEVA